MTGPGCGCYTGAIMATCTRTGAAQGRICVRSNMMAAQAHLAGICSVVEASVLALRSLGCSSALPLLPSGCTRCLSFSRISTLAFAR